MKRNSLRRLGALVLSLALTLSLAPPAWAVDPADLSITGPNEVEKGKSIELNATWKQGVVEPTGVSYQWSLPPTVTGVSLTKETEAKVTVTADNTAAEGKVVVTLTAKWTEGTDSKEATATHDVTVKAASTTPDPGPTTPPAAPAVTITPPKKTTFGLLGLAAAGAGAAGGWAALGNYLYNRVMVPQLRDPEEEDINPVQAQGRQWARKREGFKEATIQAMDGLILWAALVPGAEGCHRWAVCMHGYHDSYESMGAIAKHYNDMGWHVLMPDQRGHGQSEGDYVGWGFDERLDLVGWVNWILRRDPEAEILLHGVSMGAATVLMATGGPLPDQVKAAVSDCSYTTIEAEMRHILGQLRAELPTPLPLPAGLLFSALRKTALRRARFDLREAAPVQAVARSRTPTLFIHGVADDFVPAAMMGKLYQAARCPKSFLWMPDAGHAASVGTNETLYWTAVSTFLQDYLPDGAC